MRHWWLMKFGAIGLSQLVAVKGIMDTLLGSSTASAEQWVSPHQYILRVYVVRRVSPNSPAAKLLHRSLNVNCSFAT